jgi:hypothetical protein
MENTYKKFRYQINSFVLNVSTCIQLTKICILPEGLGDGGAHLVVQLLCWVGVEVGHSQVFGAGAVHAGNHVTHGPALL